MQTRTLPYILHQLLVSILLQLHIEAEKPSQSSCEKPASPNITPKTVSSITNPQLSLLPNSSHSCHPCHLTSPFCHLCIYIVSWWGKEGSRSLCQWLWCRATHQVCLTSHTPQEKSTCHSMSPIFKSHYQSQSVSFENLHSHCTAWRKKCAKWSYQCFAFGVGFYLGNLPLNWTKG